MLELNSSAAVPGQTVIKFANQENGQEMLVLVQDKYPQMENIHIEGRRYVEVSIEMFVGLMQQVGWLPVAPTAPPPEEDVYDEDGEGDEKRA